MKISKGLLMSTGLLGVLVIVLATWCIYKVIVPKTEVDKTVTTQEKQVTEKNSNKEKINSNNTPKFQDERMIEYPLGGQGALEHISVGRLFDDGNLLFKDLQADDEHEPKYQSTLDSIVNDIDIGDWCLSPGEFRWLVKNYFTIPSCSYSSDDFRKDGATITYEVNDGYSVEEADSEFRQFIDDTGIRLARRAFLATDNKTYESTYNITFKLHYKG